MYIHDGDYYQEYSYEVLTKISVDRYADMFKKVMHVAGTKFFGSAVVVEEANVALTLSGIGTSQEIQFNSATDISSANETIELDIQAKSYEFNALNNVNQETEFFTLTNLPVYNPVKLVEGDLVQYISNTGNYIGIGDGTSTMTNAAFYYVVFANSSGVKLSTTLGGSVLNVNTAAIGSEKHVLLQYINPFANGDLVTYTTSTGNVAVIANITGSFTTNTGKVINDFIKVPNHTFRNSDYVNVTFTDTTCNTQQFNSNTNVTANTANNSNNFIAITAHPFANGDSVLYYTAAGNTVIGGLSNNEIYYVIEANTNTFKLTSNAGNANNILQLIPSQSGEAGHYLLRGFNGITNAASYYVMDANTSGFKLTTTGNRNDIINFKSSNTNLTLNLSQTNLTNSVSYYVVNTTPNTIKLSLTSNGSPINITANTTTSGSNTAGHYLTKTVEE
jgi:hypothetical protein